MKAPTLAELIQQRSHEVKRVKRCARHQKDLTRFFEEVEKSLGGGTLVDGIHTQHLAPLVYIKLAAATVEKRTRPTIWRNKFLGRQAPEAPSPA